MQASKVPAQAATLDTGLHLHHFQALQVTPEYHSSRNGQNPGGSGAVATAPPPCHSATFLSELGTLAEAEPRETLPVPSCWPSSPTDESAGISGHRRGLTTVVPGAVRRQECAECGFERSACTPLRPAPWGRLHREVGKVNDTVFVKGLGRQVHSKMKTKTDSFLGLPAEFPIPPTHARLCSRPGCSVSQAR